MQRYDRPHTFFYLAPPYWQAEGYGVPFLFCKYQASAEAMRGLQGKALLGINDHPDIRTCFAGMNMEGVEIG
jgi:DNA adenine methylase